MPESIPNISLDPEKAFFILMKAREFDAKTESADLQTGSNPTDDKEVAVLEDSPDDAVEEELSSALEALNEDEQLDLLTLTWIGRGDFDIADFAKARDEAVNLEHKHISLYSKQTPLFSDYLEEGLSLAGYDLDQYERDHF
ncbi:MAG: DUF3775 domain-containing protein [Pseudomonadota bacterium]